MTNPLPRAVALSLLLAPATAQGIAYEWSLGSGVRSVASAGDVDGDGVADFVIATKGVGAALGRVDVRSGLDGCLLWSALGAKAGDGFGASVVALGDLDGDGLDDLAAAATQVWAFGFGPPAYVRALSGADGSTLWQVDAASLVEQFGRSLARLSDRDGDGVDDLIVGSTLASPDPLRILSGASGALALDVPTPAGAGADFGTVVAALGDLDGDGFEEFGVGDPGFPDGPGRISVHSGRDGRVQRFLGPPVQVSGAGSSFGRCFEAMGDVNADGIPDLAVAGPDGGGPAQPNGAAWVLSLSDGSVVHEFAPEAGSSLVGFGHTVARTDDLDGDGVADLRVSAGYYLVGVDPWIYVSADLRTYSGATGRLLQSWPELASTEIGVVPDVNGDGRSDVLLALGSVVVLALDSAAEPQPWPACPGQDSSNGCTPLIQTQGTPSLTQFADLEVHVSKLPAGTVGLCLYGPDATTTPFGAGVLCVASPFLRTPLEPSTLFAQSCGFQASAAFVCTLAKPDLAALGLAPGDEFFVQGWFRDLGFAPPNDFGLSGSLSIQLWP